MFRYALGLSAESVPLYKGDLPAEYSSLENYRATLAHKSNHMRRNNARFNRFNLHPVLGYIMAIVAIKDIPAGKEVFTNYGYNEAVYKRAGISNDHTTFECMKVTIDLKSQLS